MSELSTHVARLTKERDSTLGKMRLMLKTCKQLEQEKQAMMADGPGALPAAALLNPLLGDVRGEIQPCRLLFQETSGRRKWRA